MNARFIDFHSHFYDRAWFQSPSTRGQGILARALPLLTDKVLSAPAALLVEPGKQLPAPMIERINDRLAELVSKYPERLLALATIDAFQGEMAAREVELPRVVSPNCGPLPQALSVTRLPSWPPSPTPGVKDRRKAG